jgi:hypothetical protein
MLKKLLFFMAIFSFSGLRAQEGVTLYKIKKILVSKDTIFLEKTSINSNKFKILDKNNQPIDSSFYKVNFAKGSLFFKENTIQNIDSVTVHYLQLPDFLTKEYRIYDSSKVVSNDAISGTFYKLESESNKKNIPFDGLTTSGSITRGVTIGNNQNSVLNSNLDLQITGKISDKVSLRASIQDSNIPLQDGGYSQRLDQFDTVFMELFSDKWNIRAGDVFLENKKTSFLNFNKKVQGLGTNFDFGTAQNKTTVFASAALVKGQYAKSNLVGQEGNQGPYKLIGQNGELYVLVISGSERVYVNGILKKRGENNDYTIDYNAGEILFTPLFPISSEMRITIEYQFSDRNYSRFVSYAGTTHENEKWSLGGYFYSENDLKNQPLQQNLSKEQAQILSEAGDVTARMVAQSAYVDTFSYNKVLYKKTTINSETIFENSTDTSVELFNVRFSPVGANKGNYSLKNSSNIGRVFEYVPPVNGLKQGNYEPIIQLVAPTQLQVATFLGKYSATGKTMLDFEIGVSNNDQNLFSDIDDSNNKGFAGKIKAKQRLFSKKWNIDAFTNLQLVQQNFKTVERLNTIEFNRDWNLSTTVLGNQSLVVAGLDFELNPKRNAVHKSQIHYQIEKLNFAANFSGTKHLLSGFYNLKKWSLQNKSSFLTSNADVATSSFIRNQSQLRYHFKKNWVGSSWRLEDNQEKNKTTQQFTGSSQKFSEYGVFAGRGDSTKVFVELQFLKRNNDSLQNGWVQRVNSSRTFALKSKLIETPKNNLSIVANYRVLDFVNQTKTRESSLNSRILYNDRFFNQLIQSTTAFETNSGSIPQQEFTYLEVPAGKGVYTWNDYNNNTVKELQEFEVAPFPDQAKYIRVYLPNRTYIKTHQNKFSQSFTLNPTQWQNESGFKKLLSYFYNQTAFIIDRKVKNQGDNFDLNPFTNSGENILGLNSSLRNSLFYNRGKQNHSVTYSYLQNKAKNLLSIGSQEANNHSHQLQYNHLYQKYWLFGFFAKTIQTDIDSENFPSKNYKINGYQLAPKISYLFSKNASWDLFYEYQKKTNKIGSLEILNQTRFGTSFSYASDKKITVNGEVSYYQNKFSGSDQSPVGFQMLEGLQTGENLTWRLLFQKNLTQFLDFNINYQGRKSQTSQTIHTGSVQLRASF